MTAFAAILIAAPIVMWLRVSRKDLEQPERKARPEAVV